jgi:hypothetical protein
VQAKLGAVVMTALTLMYLWLLGGKAITLLQQPNGVGKIMGAFMLIMPAVALWAIIVELIFGIQVEKMAAQVEAEGVWPIRDIETLPSGRPTKAAAQREFERLKEEANAKPDDWHSWFNLALGYDACGDRKRARAGMRKALKMRKAA